MIAAIGQGYVLATPMQLAVMTSRLVNGGFAVTPRLTRDQIEDNFVAPGPEHQFPSIGISEVSRRIVMQAMDQVVNHVRGTARRSQLKDPSMAMGGKTGTSQVRRISMAEREEGVRKNEEKLWRERAHALFDGYAPVQAPQYVVSVVVEHGGGGSKIQLLFQILLVVEVVELRDLIQLQLMPLLILVVVEVEEHLEVTLVLMGLVEVLELL